MNENALVNNIEIFSIINIMAKLYKLVELNNNNYIYYYEINNNKNIYKKYMLLKIYDFYHKYNKNGNYIQNIYIRNIKLNQYGKIFINNYYITPKEYFEIYV